MSEIVQVKDVVRVYLEASGMSLRGFADALAEQVQADLSHATIINWRDGRSAPDTDFLCLVLMRYGDWRREFALDALAAKAPETWGVDGGLWSVMRDRVCGK